MFAACAAAALLTPGAASGATLTYAAPTVTYAGTPAAETVNVESLSATSVKFWGMAVGQIGGALPAGCSQTNNPNQGQIVVCDIATLGHVSVAVVGGDDTVSESGLSKESDVAGGDGDDAIVGGSQADAIDGGAGKDSIKGASGADTITAQDGIGETVDCGLGVDTATADSTDALSGCERATVVPVDRDGDGVSPPADCDDTRADVHPGATDTPGDGIDQDCTGADAVAPTGPGGGGTGAGGTPAGTTGGSAGTPAGDGSGGGAANTATGTGLAVNNPTTTPAPSAPGSNGSGIFGVNTTGGTPGITVTTTSTTSTGAPVGRALIIAANPTITFRVLRARRFTRAAKLTVAPVPAGATVAVTCKGPGCPAKGYRKAFPAGLDHLVVRSIFDLATLRAGAVIKARVTKPGVIGRAMTYRVNARAVPDAEASCLAPGTGLRTTC